MESASPTIQCTASLFPVYCVPGKPASHLRNLRAPPRAEAIDKRVLFLILEATPAASPCYWFQHSTQGFQNTLSFHCNILMRSNAIKGHIYCLSTHSSMCWGTGFFQRTAGTIIQCRLQLQKQEPGVSLVAQQVKSLFALRASHMGA